MLETQDVDEWIEYAGDRFCLEEDDLAGRYATCQTQLFCLQNVRLTP